MSIVTLLLTILFGLGEPTLRDRARALPDVKIADVDRAVAAAQRHATRELDAELLVSIMWGESRFEPVVRHGRVCGVMQVSPADIGRPRSDCDLWERDVDAAVAAGVRELEMLLADSRVRGDMRRALLYRACGNAAFDGTCRKLWWPEWVLDRANALRGIPRARSPRPSTVRPALPSS